MILTADKLSQRFDYPNFPEFQRTGIDLSLTSADTILALQRLRTLSGVTIYPGPDQQNWGRRKGRVTSYHYVGELPSQAGDIFPARGQALRVWATAQSLNTIKGLGLYLDTDGLDGHPWIMIHFDLRSEARRVLWIRKNHQHINEGKTPDAFWTVFQEVVDRDIHDAKGENQE